MAKVLRVGPDLTLPDDAVTQTFVVFGKRGSGKSNTGVVLAEEMHRVGGQIIVLDPIGAWWGLKSSFDGAAAGLPVYVFGGTHGDLPLAPTAGQLMAQVAIAHRIPMVLDMTGWAGAERARFVTAFARWLLEHNDRVPVHVFLEEADAFIPQRPFKGEEEMLGTVDRLIRWGRAAGIGATAITQRAAKVNKDVTTQAEVLVAHRTIGPQDVDAIKQWIKYHASGDEQQEILSSLPTLPDGTAWVWSPDWLDILRQVAFRRRSTFDSASTPKLGEKRVQPKALAPVDVDALRDKLAATVDEAKANDPAELRKRIRELERLASTSQPDKPPEVIEKIVEVPVLNGQLERLEAVAVSLANVGEQIGSVGDEILTAIARVQAAPRPAPVIPAVRRDSGREPDRGRTAAPPVQREASASRPADVLQRPPAESESLGKAERSILGALAAYPIDLSREQLAFLSGYHPRSSGYVNALGKLRTMGLVSPGFPAALTAAGRIAAPVDALPPGDVVQSWLARFGKAERTILELLIAAHPDPVDREVLAEQAGYHPRSSGFVNALGKLRGLGLVDGFAISAGFAALLEASR